MSRSSETLAKALVTTGLLTEAELRDARATNDVQLTEWIAGQGILPAKVVNQALGGDALALGRYRILGRVGRGGMGAVLRAHDESLGRDVAIKVLPQNAKEDDLLRFKREAKVLATISHENVVKIYAFEVVAGCAFLVMQLVEGPSLEKRLSEPPHLSEDEAWDLLAQCVDALANAERHEILHRDLKPGNILCEDDGDRIIYRLCDFGLARIQSEPAGRTTSQGFAMGTPAYMSPEQVQGKPLDSRSDMYGLGLTLYQALTGEIPFEGAGRKIAVILAARLHEDVYDVRSKRPEVSEDLAKFLLRLVERDREKRPASWDAIHRELLRRRHGIKDSAGRRSVSSGSADLVAVPDPPRTPWALVLGAGAVVVGSLGLALSGVLDPAPLPPDLGAGPVTTAVATAPPAGGETASVGTLTPDPELTPVAVDRPPVPTPPKPSSPDRPPDPPKPPSWDGRITDSASYARALAAAERGEALAAFRVGKWLLAKGETIEGFDWIARAAKTFPPAMVAVGDAYARGVGVIEDRARAKQAYARAAEAGDPEGAFALGRWVLREDPARARALFAQAAEHSDPRAKLELARMQERGLGGPREVDAALATYAELAEAGVVKAMLRLGVLLVEGEGVKHDRGAAAEWFRRSADVLPAGWARLGELQGDPAEAARSFARAAEGGDPRGMYRLALALNRGKGVAKDKAAAAEWMGKAAKAGYPPAMGEYGTMFTLGLGVDKNLARGVEWYRKGAKAGDAWSMNNLALAFDMGVGVEPNDAKADAWYRKAAASGNQLAKQNLEVWERLASVDVDPDWTPTYPQRAGRTAVTVRKKGGTPETEAAVDAALEWLARHQDEDGRWDVDGWTTQCTGGGCVDGGAGKVSRDLGGSDYDVGVTSLALLAFLGRGETHLEGPHRVWVRRGLRWLLGQQDERGVIGFRETLGDTTYDHALATTVLCEAFALTGDRQLAKAAEDAIMACLDMRNPDGAWKYGFKSGVSDSSVTGWMIQALAAARDAGADVPREAFAGAVSWFKSVTSESGKTGYQSRGGGSAFMKPNRGLFREYPVMTAVCLLSNVECGVRKRDPIFKKQLKILQEAPPEGGFAKNLNYYYFYYGSYGLFQRGANAFRRWNKELRSVLLPLQREGGCAAGSWPAAGEWCLAGGRVYAVALNALTLEVYYRRAR